MLRPTCKIVCSVYIFIFLSLLSFEQKIYAENEQSEQIQEVFRSELVFPQEEGEIQFTLAPYYLQNGDNISEIIFPFGIEYGITDQLQIEIETERTYFQENSDNLKYVSQEYEISVMYSFMNFSDSQFHTAVGSEIGGISETEKEYALFFILARTFPSFRYSHIFAQYSIVWEEERESAANIGMYIPFGKITFTSELNFRTIEENTQFYTTNGIIWAPKSVLNFGMGVSHNLTETSQKPGIYSQLIYEFDLF